MARSATSDPIEKFRFRVTVVSLDFSIGSAVESIAALSGQNTFLKNKFSVLTRAGFSSITLPKANVNEILYRENIDNQRYTKIPGLVKFDPITLNRGVTYTTNASITSPTSLISSITSNRDLYQWYQQVNNDTSQLSSSGQLSGSSVNPATQLAQFRNDVVIEVLDRQGNSIKGWYLFNSWPISYQPGTDLNATSEEKLIESITLTYEFFLELDGGIGGLLKELSQGLAQLGASSILNT